MTQQMETGAEVGVIISRCRPGSIAFCYSSYLGLAPPSQACLSCSFIRCCNPLTSFTFSLGEILHHLSVAFTSSRPHLKEQKSYSILGVCMGWWFRKVLEASFYSDTGIQRRY